MIRISQTDYIDFISKSGISKLTKVRSLVNRQAYHPSFDFYKKIREEIIENLKKGKKSIRLDFITDIVDKKKQTRYNFLVKGFKKFIGRKEAVWFDPPATTWSYNDLLIKMNPEVGLSINGEKYIIKLYFKDTPLQKKDIKVLLSMMNQTLCTGLYTGLKCALLDVEKGKLFPYTGIDKSINTLLEAEADYFIRLWHDLEKKAA